MTTMSPLLLLLASVVLLMGLPTATAFSAHLSRPWQPPKGGATTIALRRQQGRIATVVTRTQAVVNDKDNDEEIKATEDDEERMVLEDAPRVFIAPSNAATMSVNKAPDPAEKLTLMSCLPTLWAMTRPTNFLGVIIFHVLGTYLSINKMEHQLVSILLKPQQIVVLCATLLTSATSMMVNDYYDSRAGVDDHKINRATAPPRIVKRFLGILYAALLLCVTVVPGIPARLAVIVGTMLTFLYTQHLKPITWIKTITCAILIASAPLTSALSASALTTVSGSGQHEPLTSLWRLTAMLFCGFVGREIMMDINDVVDDRQHKIKTVPVRYGRQLASRVALGATLAMAALSLTGTVGKRQRAFALAGSLAQTRRAVQVARTNGEDPEVVARAVDEGKNTVLLLLASFF
jgi:4-hydroxybenzoate polyprenyltransferase